MTNIGEAANMYIHQLTALQGAGSQCDYLITLGLRKSPVGPIRTNSNRISSYRATIWINAKGMGNCPHFTSEGDSLLVCGTLTIYEGLYDGESQEEISSNPPDFPRFMFDKVIYPEIKQNGLLKCYEILRTLQKISCNNKGE